MTPEGRVKAEIKAYLTSIGAWYFMPSMNGRGRNGVPDFVVCYQGRFFGIEAKAINGKVTPWQNKEITNIKNAGGTAIVAQAPNHIIAIKECFGEY